MGFQPGPSDIRIFILMFGLTVLTLYFDYVMEIRTNPVIFFLSVVGYPVLVAAVSSRRERVSVFRMVKIWGDWLTNLGGSLIVGGITLLFFFLVTRPMAMVYHGTDTFKSILVFYFPLEIYSLRSLVELPEIQTVLFYVVVAIGEEIMKVLGMVILANWLYDRGIRDKTVITIIAFLISFLAWLSCHFVAWGGLPIGGILMGILISLMWLAPVWLAMEPILSPMPGLQFWNISIVPCIVGHAMYDILVSMMMGGSLVGAGTGFLPLGIGMIIAGIFLLGTQYIRLGIVKIPIIGGGV